jgi:hypothetical protein
MMDAETVRWIVTGLMGFILWFGKREMDTTKGRLDQLEARLPNYLHKSDFKEFKDELKEMFTELKQDIRDLKSAS